MLDSNLDMEFGLAKTVEDKTGNKKSPPPIVFQVEDTVWLILVTICLDQEEMFFTKSSVKYVSSRLMNRNGGITFLL